MSFEDEEIIKFNIKRNTIKYLRLLNKLYGNITTKDIDDFIAEHNIEINYYDNDSVLSSTDMNSYIVPAGDSSISLRRNQKNGYKYNLGLNGTDISNIIVILEDDFVSVLKDEWRSIKDIPEDANYFNDMFTMEVDDGASREFYENLDKSVIDLSRDSKVIFNHKHIMKYVNLYDGYKDVNKTLYGKENITRVDNNELRRDLIRAKHELEEDVKLLSRGIVTKKDIEKKLIKK